MKIFQCGHCGYALYFESHLCENCGHLSGFRDEDRKMLTFEPNLQTHLISDREQRAYKYCKNKTYKVCNWIIDIDSNEEFCEACQLNRTIPNLSNEENYQKWKDLEIAKHRLVYQLQKIGLTLNSKIKDSNGLCFDFVAQQDNPNLMTGHADGVITVLLREADFVLREQTRKQFLEPYRTLIGHLRHEVGHYYWNQLILSDQGSLSEFRSKFGDERIDYGEALKHYYEVGAPSDWQNAFISKYATSHPWEDWAETWAHYLHIMDMVETAYFFNVQVKPKHVKKATKTKVSFDPYREVDFDTIVNISVPLSFAVNSINRAMGLQDVYPFIIKPAVVEKMKFIHQLLLPKRRNS